MNGTRKLQLNAGSAKRRAETFLRRRSIVVLMALISMIGVTANAQDPALFSFDLTPPSGPIADCLPDATARVTVFSREDIRGVDTLALKAKGLPPNTEFTVFLTELPGPPFGAVEYIGELTTNAAGRGSLRVDTVVDEAFSSTLVGSDRIRKELNHVVIWFADPAADDLCFGPEGGVKTPFDGDGEAGVTVLSSADFLPGAPLP